MAAKISRTWAGALAAIVAMIAMNPPAFADGKPAKALFGAEKLPTQASPSSFGFYSKGCVAGAVAIPTDGPTWQAMRLSRNRRWGHPELIALLERLSQDGAKYDGWPGLLLGDISQPRGGPMVSGHASHQVGLDADIWLTPMPPRTLTANERETISATSMLKKNARLTVDDRIWTPAHARIIMRAASYPQVERIFVNPSIKKKLCETWTGDRSNLGKVRPYYGHDYHFHVRIKCPEGSPGCKAQAAVPAGDGCGKPLAWWYSDEPWAPAKKDPNAKPAPKPKPMQVSDLPKACSVVLEGKAASSEAAATFRGGSGMVSYSASSSPAAAQYDVMLPAVVPLPLPRPMQQ
ncbi:penicillin-insensitive murein endopeptidase [Agrobacterium sp. ES01]|uniref:penicillin-insensitive murein endopeptidase n=1 Tax=Agrobacterium sp. ES01 TaxID=3420714 RepID=UPI003D14484D